MTWHPDIPEEYRNQIVTGDARELAKWIPDESIDLIFTDPVYDRIEDYEWLSDVTMRVLKPEGALLCWSNGRWNYKNTKWLEKAGLNYRWTFGYINNDTFAPMNGKIIAKTNRLIWMDVDGESSLINYVVDGYIGYGHRSTLPKVKFRWYKSAPYTAMMIAGFVSSPAIILDPFCGSGVVPASAVQALCNHISFEIDSETAELARERVLNTQPPLFIPKPEQLAMPQ